METVSEFWDCSYKEAKIALWKYFTIFLNFKDLLPENQWMGNVEENWFKFYQKACFFHQKFRINKQRFVEKSLSFSKVKLWAFQLRKIKKKIGIRKIWLKDFLAFIFITAIYLYLWILVYLLHCNIPILITILHEYFWSKILTTFFSKKIWLFTKNI